ncbi:MAG: LacI family DNA-binding transcriptional regulator [Muribaculaceae bacterium]
MKYVTIKDIAKELEISKSTVSRALSGDTHNVSERTMQRIIATAKRMGYRRNELAVDLRRQSTRNIGIIIPEIVTPFFMKFIQCAQAELKDSGYQLIIAVSNEDPEQERDNIKMLERCRVEGMMISVCHNDRNIELYRDVIASGIPMVFFDRAVKDIDASQVKIDDYIMAFFMVEALIRRGRRKIVHLSGPKYISNGADRHRGYRDALEKFKIPYDPRYVIPGGLNADEGGKAMEAFLAKGLDFDAVFGFTETAMLGAKSMLQKMHYAIPDDVALCCISGTELCTLVHPTVTAVEQPVAKMAAETCRLLVEQIANPEAKKESILLRGDMILREST